MSAEDAAAHIGALYRLATLLSDAVEAQVMEACWRILQLLGDADAEALLRSRTPLTLDRARAMARCWEAARANRGLMDLASSRPSEALRLVSGVAEAMGGDGGDETDAEVARLLALPARRRRTALRELVASREASRSARHPDDVERIAELEDRTAALEAERATVAHPALAWAETHRLMSEATELLETLLAGLSGRTAAERHRERLLRGCDSLMAVHDRIVEALGERPE